MRYVEHYSHQNGEDELKQRDLYDWVTDIFEAPHINIGKRSTTAIRDHVRSKLMNKGWSGEIPVDPAFDLTVFSLGQETAFQIQTGNVSRAFYDLMKLQHLYNRDKIKSAILAVPSLSAAKNIGSNIANFNRLMNELPLFKSIITLPLTLISFE